MREPEYPEDGVFASVLRTALDAAAWVGAPWAAADLLGQPWAIAPVALAVIGIPWLVRRLLPLSPQPPEGKVSLPGLIRVTMAFDLHAIAAWAMWYLLGPTAGVATILFALASQALNFGRSRWMLAGAPAA